MRNLESALQGLSKPSEKPKTKVEKVDLGKAGSFKVHKGALHKALGIPQGQKIPASKLKAKPGDSERVKHEKASAKGFAAMKH
jgi:hypothetical protein